MCAVSIDLRAPDCDEKDNEHQMDSNTSSSVFLSKWVCGECVVWVRGRTYTPVHPPSYHADTRVFDPSFLEEGST